jgi:urea transporter
MLEYIIAYFLIGIIISCIYGYFLSRSVSWWGEDTEKELLGDIANASLVLIPFWIIALPLSLIFFVLGFLFSIVIKLGKGE